MGVDAGRLRHAEVCRARHAAVLLAAGGRDLELSHRHARRPHLCRAGGGHTRAHHRVLPLFLSASPPSAVVCPPGVASAPRLLCRLPLLSCLCQQCLFGAGMHYFRACVSSVCLARECMTCCTVCFYCRSSCVGVCVIGVWCDVPDLYQ